MNYDLEVSPSVIKEVTRIYFDCEGIRSGSGMRFLKELDACYKSICANPFGCQVRKSPYRYVFLYKLKYRVVHDIKGQTVLVFQGRHTSRKPTKKSGP